MIWYATLVVLLTLRRAFNVPVICDASWTIDTVHLQPATKLVLAFKAVIKTSFRGCFLPSLYFFLPPSLLSMVAAPAQ